MTDNSNAAPERIWPDAADGSPSLPMEPELWAAGCDLDTARFVARQLAKDGYALVKADKFDAMLKAEHDKIAGLVMVLRAYEPETEYERGFDDACAAVLREIRALAQEGGE